MADGSDGSSGGEKVRKFRILDANVFIRCGGPESLAKLSNNQECQLITCQAVIDEVKSRKSRTALSALLPFITIKQCTAETLESTAAFTKSSTDYDHLSAADLQVIALTVDLSKQCCMTHAKASQKTNSYRHRKVPKTARNKNIIPGFFDPKSGDEGWIKPGDRFEEIKQNQQESFSHHVACVTSDFDIQNVLLKMGLNVVDLEDNKFITELKYYTSLCRYCGLTNRHQGEKFCVHCGLKGMSKVTASLTKNGDTRLHLSKHFSLNTKKGFDEPTKRFQGGKHPNMGALSKGHRVAQQKAPCKRNKNASRSSNHNVEFTGDIFQPHILNSKAFKNGIK